MVSMAVKLTIIVDNPNDPGAFEAVYNSPANKELLANHGGELWDAAGAAGVRCV